MKVFEILRYIGVTPSKELGQNFIIEPAVIQRIVDFGRPSKSENLLEIGPGLGALTAELVNAGASMTVIEIENKFADFIEKNYPTIKVIRSDVRLVDFSEIGGNLTVFGNLPYSFSSDIVIHLLENYQQVNRAVLMFQKEFAERLAAKPGGKDYGALTIVVQMRADVELGPIIPGTAFHPSTEVESQVLEMKFLKAPRYEIKDQILFQSIVQGAFKKRRKKALSTVAATAQKSKERVEQAFTLAGLNRDVRPEEISIEAYVKIANILSDI